MVFKNYTPHPIALNGGETFDSKGVARVAASFSDFSEDLIASQVFGEITGLPAPEEGTCLIVSALVLSAAKEQGRTDCLAPATGHPQTVRDEKGFIISVPGFVR